MNLNRWRRHAATASLFLALPLSATGATMNKPDVKLNPNPRMRYEITVEVNDAPGPFDTVDANINYRVSNDACVPLTPVVGATVAPTRREPVKLTHAGGNTYKGEFFADLLQDEDYYGKGVCHWSVVSADVEARKGKMDFASSVFNEDIFNHKEVTRFYANRAYAEDQTALVNSGNPDRSQFKDPSKTFSITLRAAEKAL